MSARFWRGTAIALGVAATAACNNLLGLDPGRAPLEGGGGRVAGTMSGGAGAGGGGGGNAGCGDDAGGCASLVWAAVFGDNQTLRASVTSVGADAQGGIVIAGYFGPQIAFGSTLYAEGAFDYFLVKFDATGVPLWAKRFGSVANDAASFPLQVAVAPNGRIVVAGAANGDIDLGGGPLSAASSPGFNVIVAKYDDQGNHLWSKRFVGSSMPQVATQVAFDASGDILLAGWFEGALDLGGGPLPSLHDTAQSGFVAKLAGPTGAHVWSSAIDAMQSAGVGALATDTAGNVTVAGTLDGFVDFGGPTLSGYGLYTASFDHLGKYVWGKATTATGNALAAGAEADPFGNTVLAGTFSGTVEFGGAPAVSDTSGLGGFLAKLGPKGDAVWSRAVPTTLVALDGLSQVIVGGWFTESVDFGDGPLVSLGGKDIALAKYDATGAYLWAKRFGDSQNQYATAVGTMPGTNRIVLAAGGGGGVDFGNGALAGAGTTSVWLAVFDP
jgi:hypothetical protein